MILATHLRNFQLLFGILLIGLSSATLASGLYKPFVMAEPAGGSVEQATNRVTETLVEAGLEILGEYSPYPDGSARVIGVTNEALKKAATIHVTGGFGAVMRVAITNNNGVIEVSYTNPSYLGHAYRIGDLDQIDRVLSRALEGRNSFGAEGFSAEQLANYHYMAFMPYFDDQKELGSFASYEEAITKLDQALAHPDSDLRQVWKVNLPNEQTLYGVQLHGGEWQGQMKNVMAMIDVSSPKSTAALPWELLVSGDTIYYLPGKYRIALMFPDLSMGQFMKISHIPGMMERSAKELMKLAH